MESTVNIFGICLLGLSVACILGLCRRLPSKSGWRMAALRLRSRDIAASDALFAAAVALMLTAPALFTGAGEIDPGASGIVAYAASLLVFPLALMAVTAGAIRMRGGTLSGAFGPLEARAGDAVAGITGGIAMLVPTVVLGIAVQYLSSAAGFDQEIQPMLEFIAAPDTPFAYKLVTAFSAVVVTPIAEEVAFRGAIFGALAKSRGIAASIALSSLFFAAIHLNLESIPQLAFVGACFALAYLVTGRLAVPVAMHMVHNAVAIATALVS